ncbi:uncharacterized protein LOC126292123 [Schistocerca gregaria]|uniref:uncharacterized protein LOC126292123 n=1 Tax=Schistocerca gregaria TaxID=7010 RepID=UPI00211ECEFE|nr:uncharacterized protein LOC126292123 [Schistocerca gregaria]
MASLERAPQLAETASTSSLPEPKRKLQATRRRGSTAKEQQVLCPGCCVEPPTVKLVCRSNCWESLQHIAYNTKQEDVESHNLYQKRSVQKKPQRSLNGGKGPKLLTPVIQI